MRMRALERLGHQVHGVQTVEPWRRASWLGRQIQRRMQRGPIIDEINSEVLTAAKDFKPSLVWAEKQEFLRIDTMQKLRKLSARLIHFTPDPYFTLSWKRTRLMDEAMRHFDVLVFCKNYECKDYEAIGKSTVFMPLGYCDEVHRPLSSEDQRWSCDLGFLGGWEPRREQMLGPLADGGLRLKIWGGYWDFLKDGRWTLRRRIIMDQLAGGEGYGIDKNEKLAACLQGGEVYGDDYARALTGSKIGLGFLRKVCPDQHTTRSFEIPACGSMLLADRTEEHQGFFTEGKEAEFFSCKEELLEKAQYYCAHDAARLKIANAGYQRCVESKYAYVHRMETTMAQIAKL